MKKQQGFTLIELMIVVAIIAILAAIALPMYQDYVAKSQAAAGLSEITGGKTATEVAMNEGKDVATAEEIGLKTSTRCTKLDVKGTAATGEASIACTLAGNSQVTGKTITIKRAAADGTWSCETGVAKKYAPTGCTGV